MFWKLFKKTKTDKSDKLYGRVAIRFGTRFREYNAMVTSIGVVYVNHDVMDILIIPTDKPSGAIDSDFGEIDYHWLDHSAKKET